MMLAVDLRSPYMKIILPVGVGVGAQILSKILYDHLSLLYPDKVFADMSYFRRAHAVGSGVSRFDWELSYYGIADSDFNDLQVFGMNPTTHTWLGVLSRIYRKTSFVKFLDERSSLRQFFMREALGERSYDKLFPVSLDHLRQAGEYVNDDGLVVVHLRRGDYLKVASHVVIDEDVFLVLNRLTRIGVKKALLISDSPVNVDSFSLSVPGITDWNVLVSDDIFLCHAVMRLAPVLVISNSQFSLSAALLSLCDNPLVIMPRQWFGSELSVLQEHILSLSKWCIMS